MSVEAAPSKLQAPSPRVASVDACRFVSVTTPAPRAVWKNLIAQDADALPYQSPEWTDSACATGRFVDVSRLYETADGRQFVLPLIARAGLPSWLNIAGSMPSSWGIGGPIGSAPLTAPVIAAMFDDLRRAGFLAVHIRPNPLHASVWQSAPFGEVIPRRAHVLDLAGGFDAVWEQRFNGRVRRIIRKAEGVVDVEFDTTGRLLPQFYALLEKSWLRWAAAQHEPEALALWRARRRDPYRRFKTMAATMGEGLQVGLASIGGQPVATIIVLRGRNTNYSRGAMDAELIGNSGANDLLQKLAIEQSAKAGHRYYHMGESGHSASLSQFKEKFGAVAYEYAEYRIERLPLTRIDKLARTAVKRLIGFKDGS